MKAAIPDVQDHGISISSLPLMPLFSGLCINVFLFYERPVYTTEIQKHRHCHRAVHDKHLLMLSQA